MGRRGRFIFPLVLLLLCFRVSAQQAGQQGEDGERSRDEEGREGMAGGDTNFDINQFAVGIDDPFGGGDFRDDHEDQYGSKSSTSDVSSSKSYGGSSSRSYGGSSSRSYGGSSSRSYGVSSSRSHGGFPSSSYSDGDEIELFPAPGVIVDGLTFDDAVDFVTDVVKADTILQSAGIVCENRNAIDIMLPEEVDEVCGLIETAVANNRPVTGIEEFCDDLFDEDGESSVNDGDGPRRKRDADSYEDSYEYDYSYGDEYENEDSLFLDGFQRALDDALGVEVNETGSYCNLIAYDFYEDPRPTKEIVDGVLEELVAFFLDAWSVHCLYNYTHEDWGFGHWGSSESSSSGSLESSSSGSSESGSSGSSESGSSGSSESGSSGSSESSSSNSSESGSSGSSESGSSGSLESGSSGSSESGSSGSSESGSSGSLESGSSGSSESGSSGSSESSFSGSSESDSWGSSQYGSWNSGRFDEFGPYDIIGYVLSAIGGYSSTSMICEHIEIQNQTTKVPRELVANMTSGLLRLVQNEEDCMRLGDLLREEFFGPGAPNVSVVCRMITESFSNETAANVYVDRRDIFDQTEFFLGNNSRMNYTEGSRRWPWLELGNSNNTNEYILAWYALFNTEDLGPYAAMQYLRPEQLISLVGKMYNARNSREAFSFLCGSFSPNVRGFDLNLMCEAADTGAQHDLQYVCEYWGLYGLFEEFDWDAYWEDFYKEWYLDNWRRQENEIWTHFIDSVPWTIMHVFDKSWSPMDMCNLITEEISKPHDAFRVDIDRIIEGVLVDVFFFFISEPCHEIVFNPNSTSHFENIFGPDEPEPKSIRKYALSVMTYLGGYESHVDFCNDIFRDFEAITPENFRDLYNTMLDAVEQVVTTEESCGELVEAIKSYDSDFSVLDWTGFADSDELCVAVVDSYEGDGSSVAWSSLVDLVLDMDSLSSSELAPGMLADGIPFRVILAVLGTAWNSGDLVADGLAVVCDSTGPIIAEWTGFDEREVRGLCSALSDNDFDAVKSKCQDFAFPWFYGEHFPMGMIGIDGDDLLERLREILGWESFDQEGVCPGLEDLLNEDFSLIDKGVYMLEGMLPYFGEKHGVPFCRNLAQNKAYWQGVGRYYDESRSDYDQRLLGAPRPEVDFDIIDAALSVSTGMGSVGRICDLLVEANDAGGGELDEFYQSVISGLFGLVESVDRCRIAAETMLDLLLPELDLTGSSFSSSWSSSINEPWADPIYWVTGLRTPKEVCIRIVQAFTGEEAEACRGIVDCAGTCNGDARPDCAGICNGQATKDCAGDCLGTAFINNCTECVGGRTGRALDFGIDQCGMCRKQRGYRETWDCNGQCSGSAFIDRCGECVGGSTGVAYDANDGRLDCRGVCDGGWVADTCNYCEPAAKAGVTYDGGSKYKDCTGDCVKPGRNRAELNDCDVCWGGSSGLDETEGVNVCGQCDSSSSADVQSCAGCDGVPASGLEYDACGVCDGDGTNCVAVGAVIPNAVPNVATKIRVAGAGFSAGTSLTCLFTRNGQTTEGAATRLATTLLKCDVPALTPGDYEVSVQRNNDLPSEITSTLRVFQDIDVVAILPTSFTVNRSLETVDISVTVGTGALSTVRGYADTWNIIPTLTIYLDNDYFWRSYGSFDSDQAMSFVIGMPYDSGHGVLVPSLNGGNTALGQYSTDGYAYFEAPSLERVQFSNTGALLEVTFDMPVDYENFRSCGQIFNNSQALGKGALCLWRYPTSMVIVIGKGSNLVEIGSPMAVKPITLKAFRQDFSYTVESVNVNILGPAQPLQPVAIVSGASKLPSCGDIQIDARRSTGSGGRTMSYVWEVTSSGSTTALDNALNNINTNNPSASLSLDGDLMDAGTDYVFTVNVTNFLGGSDVASLTVNRASVAAPEVKILSRGVDLNSVRVADSFELTALVKFYSECVPANVTLFEWSVDNDDVALNLKTKFTRSLYVPSNSLPGGEVITFTVLVYKSDNPSAYVETTIQATTIASPLVPVIRGATELTIGRDSGDVVLDGSLSFDPDREARDWNYEWQCLQTDDNSACWSYDPSSIGTLINNGSNLDGAYLRFDALSLQADKSYEFTLVVSKEARSASTTVYISAVNGNPPKIEIPPRNDNGEIKDSQPFFLSAIVYHSTELSNVTWQTTDTGSGYGFLDFEEETNLLLAPSVFPISETVSAALVAVQPGKVSRGTTYAINITATTVGGQSGSVKTYISVLTGPTSCEFILPTNYTEFEEVTFTVDNCVTSAEPLEYQLLVVNSDDSVSAFKDATAEPTFTSIGAPRLSDTDIRTYIMKVCDGNDMCTSYLENVTVLEKVTFTAAEVTAYISDQVDTPKFAGDFSSALTNLNMASDRGLVSRRRRRRTAAEESTSDTTADQLELIQLTLDETVVTASRAQLLLDQTASVDPTTMVLADQSSFVDQLSDIIDVFISEDTAVPSDSATIVSGKLDVISEGLDPVHHETLLGKISSVRSKLSQSLASGLSVGSPRSEIQGSDGTSSVLRTLLSDSFDSKTTGSPITISFGSEVSALYGAAWTCSSGETCSGVTLKIEHFNAGIDLLSTDQNDIDNRIADILDIVLADPESDEKLNISDLAVPIELGFTLTSVLSQADLECVYWDTDTSTWSTSGIQTTDNGDGTVTCATDHLTTFTVMAVPWPVESSTEPPTDLPVTAPAESGGLSVNLIIIIAASSACGTIILLLVTVFLCKYCNKSSKVSDSSASLQQSEPEPQPQPQQQQMMMMIPQQQGMIMMSQQQQQQQPMVAMIGIPMVQGQYGMGMAQPMGMARPVPLPPVGNALPTYDAPPGYSPRPAGVTQPGYGSTVADAPPSVTLVGQNNNLVQVGMDSEPPPSDYNNKASKSSEMSSYMHAVTDGVPGVGTSNNIPMKAINGSKASLTGHR